MVIRFVIVLILVFLAGLCVCFAQGPVTDSSSGHAAPAATPKPTPVPTKISPRFKRWFDLDAALFQTRYQYIKTNSNPAANSSKQQWQVFIKGHFQLDDEAKYRVNW